MGTAVRPAKTSPGSWDAFADVDVFVDAVLAELTAMASDGARPQRPGPKPPLSGSETAHGGDGNLVCPPYRGSDCPYTRRCAAKRKRT